ncbi:hypothetical protein PVAND_009633 [Polypedilum vanderplanki]|uniref:Uncharacterized protein n=1 Tax=Polypedilum vanderplanki TaxID=319348 RepID=A0A9J6CEA2_POLVA|nr:hypothetical protein PVAND_009633 [Polypedilum vanderplanki]
MSININVNGMQCYADRAAAEKRKINRLLMVREQSNELAHKLRNKVRLAQEQELKRIQEENRKELGEWKRRNHNQIQAKIDECIADFGNAHIAAVDASCEENEFMKQEREEKDLMAAIRGRKAMLQVQREREKQAEERIMKKKRQNLKTTGTQADFLTQHNFKENFDVKKVQTQSDQDREDEDESVFVSKPNLHKHSIKIDTNYNAQNYTTNSVDSSNNCDSDEVEELHDDTQNESESDIEFNQISNLLHKKQQVAVEMQKEDDVISISESSSSIEIVQPKKLIKKTSPKKKGILKKSPNKKNAKSKKTTSLNKKSKAVDENRVRYVDYTKGNYETTYVPPKTLITRSEKPKINARQEAQVQTDDYMISKKMNAEILKQLTEIRSQEALEKEKIRRDYERLRLELDELSKLEQEAKTKTNAFQNLTRDQLLRKENIKQRKMNEVVENAMRGNILYPPVDRSTSEKPSVKQKSNLNNVAVINTNNASRQTTDNNKKSNEELNNIVKVERLKDLLEKINHQKRLLLNEIEKNDDVPGPDLEKVMECLKKLEDEKAQLQQNDFIKINEVEKKKIEQLTEREKKVREREERLERKLRELFKQQKEATTNIPVATSSSSSTSMVQSISDETSSGTIEKKISQPPPVEIIIKVQQPKSPYKKKSSKSYRCIDTLNREPGKVYPKTPMRKKKSETNIEETEKVDEKREEIKQKQTQTSPTNSDAPKPILKNSQIKQISIPPSTDENQQKISHPSINPINIDDFSTSTVYRELPSKINIDQSQIKQKKAVHLNPNLMHYITRLLGMNKDIGNQLNVDVSSISTPGSSTINTSGNASSIIENVNLDDDRMNRLQKFIDDNYSFLSEVNESIERTQMQQRQENEYNLEKVQRTWEEVLRKKKQKSHDNQSKASSSQMKSAPTHTKTFPTTSASTLQDPKFQLPHLKPKNSKSLKQSVKILQQPIKHNIKQRPHSVPIQSRTQITTEEMEKVTKYLESKMMNNYKEYTDNCQKRINELTKMMEQVRQEKMKLIENSLSSNECNNFTEYKDIVQKNPVSSDQKDSPNRDDPPSEEINNILKTQTRPFGVSKDSGIASSRPVTSSDFRDSPDVRVTSEENNNVFQPINKIVPQVTLTTSEGNSETIKNVSQIIKQHGEKKKLLKPPASIKSFSPQIEKQHEGHELSTIAEIETPSASKVNIIPDESVGVADLHSFPNFEDYAKKINITENPLTENQSLQDMKIKTFIDPKEYGIDELSKDNDDEDNDSSSSLMDIQAELKKRDIFSKSFEILVEGKENINLVEAGFVKEGDEKTTPIMTHHMNDPTSPKRKPAQSRIVMKTPDNRLQVQIITTPTKTKKQHPEVPEPQSPKSNDTLSGIQEIENDFQNVGMAWAANMLKRTEDTQKKASSSSSDDKNDKIKIDIDLGTSSSSSDGRPLNLKEFLRREILSKTNNLTDDSSLSSRFLKSLLNASSGSTSSSSSNPKSDSTSNPKLRTSTPLRMSSEYIATKTAASSQMFAGAESMSTVKDSSSDPSEKSEKKLKI